MGSPYSGTSVSGYNANPPPDDGSTISTNQITWAGIKSKLGDPLNTFASSANSNLTTAFGKLPGGASVVSSGTSYVMTGADQGRLIRATASGITITTPDAGVVLTPFWFRIVNNSTGSITLAGGGSGPQTVDGLTTQTIAAGAGALVDTDGTNWFTCGLTPAQVTASPQPQGYLTLASDTVNIVPASDVTAATSVYYSPDTGNLCPVYNGTSFVANSFSQQTLSLVSAHTASNIFDVFAFLNSGTFTIGTGPAWSTSTAGSGARGTGAATTQLSRVGGLLVNTVSMTTRNGSTTYTVSANQGTYLGSILIDGTNGQISCYRSWGQSRKWGVWNAYNRRPIIMTAGDTTSSWSYTTNTVRASNNASGNSISTLIGLSEEEIYTTFKQQIGLISTAGTAFSATDNIGIGFNTTTATSGRRGAFGFNWNGGSTTISPMFSDAVAEYVAPPSLGANTITALEVSPSNSGTCNNTYYGSSSLMQLCAQYRG